MNSAAEQHSPLLLARSGIFDDLVQLTIATLLRQSPSEIRPQARVTLCTLTELLFEDFFVDNVDVVFFLCTFRSFFSVSR
jgi:hypothetical protein